MPASYDAEVAELFRDLRAASNLSETDLAAKLTTQIEVVQALEQGALYALPPWPETCRVVNAYGSLLNLDIRPLLRRIYAQLEAGIVELRPKAVPDVPVMAPQRDADFTFELTQETPQPRSEPQWPAANPSAPPQQGWPGGNHAAPPSSQPAWPGGNHAARPSPQTAWPGGNHLASPLSQPGWPGNSHAPAQQVPRPGNSQTPSQHAQWPGNAGTVPPQAPRTSNVQSAQPQPAWQGSQQAAAQPSPDRRTQAAPQQARASQPQQPHPLDANFEPEPVAAKPAAAEAKKRGRPPLLKWGLGALVVSVLVFGLWFALSDSTGPSGTESTGSGGTSNPVLDPDDPRSRKADRLPNAF